MRGQNALIQARANGRTFSTVIVFDLDSEPLRRQFLDAEVALFLGGAPEIDIGPTENPMLLDFRGVAGVRVLVFGKNHDRVNALMRRIKAFEPSEIIGAGNDGPILRWKPKA